MSASKLPDADEFREQLLGFNEKVWRLEHGRFFSSPAVGIRLNRVPANIVSAKEMVDKDGEPIWEMELQTEVTDFGLQHLDRENIEAFTLTYRMLTQNNDRYSIARLAENYQFSHSFFREAFTHIRELNSSFLGAGSCFQKKETPVIYREILDTVIYGELAHSNKHKAATFKRWTRWPAHEKMIWFVFDHALRCSMEILQHFRDINAATLMAHFGVRVHEESVFRRLQDKGILSKDAAFTVPND